MRFYWPRAESRVFAEARSLEERGWARTKTTLVGRRQRTTYSITRAGRAELRRWLASPPRGSSLEAEPILRFVLADLAKPDELRAVLARVRADAQAILDQGRVVAPEYLAGTAPFQDQVHIRAHLFDFLSHYAFMLLEWADRAEAGIAGWDQLSAEARDAAALELIRTSLAQFPDPAGAGVSPT